MIGIDLVDLSRIPLDSKAFVRRVLTEEEQREYVKLKDENQKREYLGGHFAAKEAIFKASQDETYLSYSVLHQKSGAPYVKDHPEISISISHDGGMAAAAAVIERKL